MVVGKWSLCSKWWGCCLGVSSQPITQYLRCLRTAYIITVAQLELVVFSLHTKVPKYPCATHKIFSTPVAIFLSSTHVPA